MQDAQPLLPYALSWYLDAVAENWDGLVYGDYEAVMPLTWFRKLGVKCLYQPYYCQQTGVFSITSLSQEVLRTFLYYCQQNYLYVGINLNSSNDYHDDGLRIKPKGNLLLKLDSSYDVLRKSYSENHRRNISKAQKNNLLFETSSSGSAFVKFYLANINREKLKFKALHEKAIKKLVHTLLANGFGEIAVAKKTDGEWLSASLLIRYGGRIINIVNASANPGKTTGAAHFLFDNVIKHNINSGLILDFEGSSVPSVARFYEGFGAQEEIFYHFEHIVGRRLSQLFR